MVGNLVDNAGKWASSRVSIEVLLEQPQPGRHAVRIVVDDDGPGLTPAQREQVARRGQRLDESKPGSGLGLSIVVEAGAALWRRAEPRHGADRRLARRTGAAGGIGLTGANRVSPQSLRLAGRQVGKLAATREPYDKRSPMTIRVRGRQWSPEIWSPGTR